ncbi:hypothetical protein M011DRAFT_525151 [Sporormia fimetaria CBS 119925]|uniref:Uncharacterized protein n=1 Tax=Sporormia fimetaria CBS 119925 TaxID=1340428 RepID=A0A6A6VJE9_9PLEO|nr:hypothetical protein M011DRAFT_525151 [Sporormia fimetaria CBS 119925]
MIVRALFSLLITALSVTAISPNPFEVVPEFPLRSGPQPDGSGGHYACSESNFTGHCQYYVAKFGECHNYEHAQWKRWTSLSPNEGIYCWFFNNGDCFGKHLELKHPGTRNLRGLRFDNMAVSWKCWKLGT